MRRFGLSATGFGGGATIEAGEPNHAGQTGGHSVWFSWTPSSDHIATLSTKRSDFDTLLAVYTGDSVDQLTPVASNDDPGGRQLNRRVEILLGDAEGRAATGASVNR